MALLQVVTAATGDGPILIPAPADLIWGSVSFLILIFLFWKYVFPRFNEILKERTEKIEGGIVRAERAQAEADLALKKYTEQMEEARAEASAIRAKAEEQRKAMYEEAKAEANQYKEVENQRFQDRTKAEISQASLQLQKEVGALALELASRVVGESLKDDARARSVIDQFIDDLEKQASQAGK